MDACTVMKREKRHNASGISNEGMQFLAMSFCRNSTFHILVKLYCILRYVCLHKLHTSAFGGGLFFEFSMLSLLSEFSCGQLLMEGTVGDQRV